MDANVFSATRVDMVERVYNSNSVIHIKVRTAEGQDEHFYIYTDEVESVPVTIKMPKRNGAKARAAWSIVEGEPCKSTS